MKDAEEASTEQRSAALEKRRSAMERIHKHLQGNSPVEQFDIFITRHALVAEVESLKQGSQTTAALDSESDMLENQLAMVKQLITSVKKGAKDLLKVVNEFQKTQDTALKKTEKGQR